MSFDLGPYLSGGRHVVTFIAGTATGIGITAIGGVSDGDLVTSFNHVFNGLNEIAVGLGPIAAAGMGVWATLRGRLGAKVADVNAATPEAVAKSASPAVVAGAATTLAAATTKSAT